MHEVYTTVPGLTMQIGIFGFATNDTPALVPPEVAAGIEDEIRGFRIEEQDDPDNPGKKKRVEVKYAPGPGRPDGREVRLRVKKVGDPGPSTRSAAVARTASAPVAAKGEKE